MKYPAIFAFTIGCSCLVFPHLGNAGGYAEPILAPEVIRPMPRPDDECQRFLFWIVCDAENPSPKREKEDPDAKERPVDKDTPADRPARDPAPVGEADRPEPPAAPDTPDVDAPPAQPPEPPVDGGDDTPTGDDTPGQNPGNDKPVGKSKWDGKRGEQPSGKDK